MIDIDFFLQVFTLVSSLDYLALVFLDVEIGKLPSVPCISSLVGFHRKQHYLFFLVVMAWRYHSNGRHKHEYKSYLVTV